MISQCFVTLFLALPLFVVADPVRPLENQIEASAGHEVKILRKFADFASDFNKLYANEAELHERYSIFKANLKKIDRLNKEHRGTTEYGITKFADLTYDEFLRDYTSRINPQELNRHQNSIKNAAKHSIEFSDVRDENVRVVNGKIQLPRRVDYREKNAVTSVKDQGKCGSSYAFSTITNVEGVYAKNTSVLLDLSVQELVDCDKVNAACDGGVNVYEAAKELARLGGVLNSTDYPYVAKKEQCRFDKEKIAVKVSGVRSIADDEDEMAKALIENGPLSVGVAVSENWQFYRSGVFWPASVQCSTDPADISHAVAIVGYGEWLHLPYWLVKNSWGPNWGDKGYMRILRKSNACAIKSYVSTVVL